MCRRCCAITGLSPEEMPGRLSAPYTITRLIHLPLYLRWLGGDDGATYGLISWGTSRSWRGFLKGATRRRFFFRACFLFSFFSFNFCVGLVVKVLRHKFINSTFSLGCRWGRNLNNFMYRTDRGLDQIVILIRSWYRSSVTCWTDHDTDLI